MYQKMVQMRSVRASELEAPVSMSEPASHLKFVLQE